MADLLSTLIHYIQAFIGYVVAFFMPKPLVPPPIQPAAKPPSRTPSSSGKSSSSEDNLLGAGVEDRPQNIFDFLRTTKSSILEEEQIRLVIKEFDENNDNKVNRSEFSRFISNLLTIKDGKSIQLTEQQKDEIFNALDLDGDGNIDVDEFRVNWNTWVRPINEPKTALIVVDVQNDFISGSLALIHCPAKQDGANVVPVVNKLRQESKFDKVILTLDSHPPGHCSFHSQVHHHELANDTPVQASDAKLFDTVKLRGPPPVNQKLWPDHCVQGSWGEELHDGLYTEDSDVIIKKGTNPNVDSYSAFWDNAKLSQTPLLDILKESNIDTVFVCGLAYDVCVGSTALHAIEHGLRTILVEDACAGVTNEGIAEMKNALKEAGCLIVQSDEVPALVSGKNRDAFIAMGQIHRIAKAKELHRSLNDSIRSRLVA